MPPEISAVAEFLPGYEASGFQGIGAPKNTPSAIIETLISRSILVLTILE
jgi:hypothetical protein